MTNKDMTKKYFLPAALFVLILTLGGFPQNTYAQTATLSFSPSGGTYAQNDTFWVSIMVNTGSSRVNALAVYFDYPQNQLESLGVDTSNSVLDFFAEKNAKDGKVEISGGLPTPGFSGSKKIASVGFRVKASSGTAVFKFTADSAVVTDAQNKNILNLSSSSQGSYAFKPAETPEPTQPQPQPQPQPQTQPQPQPQPAPKTAETAPKNNGADSDSAKTVTVKILDYQTAQPIEGATVLFTGLSETAGITNQEGEAIFGKLPPGEHKVSVDYQERITNHKLYVSSEDSQELTLIIQTLEQKKTIPIFLIGAIISAAVIGLLASIKTLKLHRDKKKRAKEMHYIEGKTSNQ